MELQGSRKKSTSIQRKSAEVLEILYGLAMLQLYDEDADAPGILQDLNDYYHGLSLPSQPPEDRLIEQSEPVVEIVLSFASKTPRFYHQAALQAFRAFAGEISRSGLQSLIRVCRVSHLTYGYMLIFNRY